VTDVLGDDADSKSNQLTATQLAIEYWIAWDMVTKHTKPKHTNRHAHTYTYIHTRAGSFRDTPTQWRGKTSHLTRMKSWDGGVGVLSMYR
jgi:hypothetical protein